MYLGTESEFNVMLSCYVCLSLMVFYIF